MVYIKPKGVVVRSLVNWLLLLGYSSAQRELSGYGSAPQPQGVRFPGYCSAQKTWEVMILNISLGMKNL